jgi:hypothetical protein
LKIVCVLQIDKNKEKLNFKLELWTEENSYKGSSFFLYFMLLTDSQILYHHVIRCSFFFLMVLGLELRAYTLSHSTSPFLRRVFLEIRSRKLFTWPGSELRSSSLPPEELGLLLWATSTRQMFHIPFMCYLHFSHCELYEDTDMLLYYRI